MGTSTGPIHLPDGCSIERPGPEPHLGGEQDQSRDQPGGGQVERDGLAVGTLRFQE